MMLLRLITLVLAGLVMASAHARPPHELPSPAVRAPLAAESLILHVIETPRNLVAVGERGHVLLSEDGRNWTQAEFVPVHATLTRVAYADERLWAVGHDSVIIHSYDYGQTWTLQHFEPDWEQPLLDVHFGDGDAGIAIGAYGLFMRTEDAGRHWEALEMADLVVSEAIDWEAAARSVREAQQDDLDSAAAGSDDDQYYDAGTDFDRGCYEFMECHLNAVVDLGDGRQMIAAEHGYGFRSSDGGQTWESFRFPYSGSMFGLLHLGGESVLAYGLRGHVQRSDDFGDSWAVLDTGLESTLMGGTVDPQGQPLMVGSGAARLSYDPESGRFELDEDRLGSDYVSVLLAPNGTLVLAGADGLSHE
ncbi:MAG: WD40/YVTN/BNR-like repeat-containing protein [Wenzhouxiangella sp.]